MMTSVLLSLRRIYKKQVAEDSYIKTSCVSYSVLVFVSGLDGERWWRLPPWAIRGLSFPARKCGFLSHQRSVLCSLMFLWFLSGSDVTSRLEVPIRSLLTLHDHCHSCVSPAQDLLVYLASDSAVHLTLEGLGCMNAQELGRNVREALNIPNSAVDVFAFWFCSPLLGNLLCSGQMSDWYKNIWPIRI